jgi:hypothetical protein
LSVATKNGRSNCALPLPFDPNLATSLNIGIYF